MKKRNLVSKIMTTGLAAALALGMSVMPVMAAEFTASDTNKVQVSKKVQYANGVTVPAQEFEFTFTQVGTEPATASIDSVKASVKATDVTKGTTASSTAITSEAIKSGDIDFSNLTTTGVYTYTVKETAVSNNPDSEGYGWQTNNDEFTMKVAKHANGTVSFVILPKDKTEAADKLSSLDNFAFTNVYTKRGGSGTNTQDEDKNGKTDSLVISKVVNASDAPDENFSFTINFTKSPTDTSDTAYTAKKVPVSGDQTDVTVARSGETTFQLKKGEKLVFNDIPAGTTYTVTETLASGSEFKPDISGTADGTSFTKAGTKATSLTSDSELIGEGTNNITFTNSVTDVTLTGISNQYGGLIAVVAIAAGGMVVLTLRRRREDV